MTGFTVVLIVGLVAVAFFLEWVTDPKSRASTIAKVRNAHSTISEDVAAKVLQQNYTAFVDLGLTLPPERSIETTAKFVALASELSRHFSNWSPQGYLQMAQRLYKEARADQHLDRSSSIAKGLAAVWVESHARNHPVAALVKKDLDDLISSNATVIAPSDNYGHQADNPVLCKDILLSRMFMASLRYRSRPVESQRLGSIRNANGILIDHYSVSQSGEHIVDLYVNAYAGSAAGPAKPPAGFTLGEPPHR